MRIKSYFVRSVDDAIALARADFGEDALLLSTRNNGGGAEVVFGSAESEPAATLDSIRAQIQELRQLLFAADREPHLSRLFAQLTNAGFDSLIATKIVDFVEKSGTLRDAFAEHVKIDAALANVTALVGPPGAGKTAVITKIAAFQKSARIVTLDASLAGRIELQLFARKSGIQFTAVENPGKLAGFIEEARKKEIVLIDTAGALPDCPGVCTQLVVPAYMSADAVRHTISKYPAEKMIVTHLDESPSIGAAISEAAHAGLAISLLASANSLHAATVDDLISIALGPERVQAASA